MANIDGDITLRVDVTPGEIDSTANEIKSKIEDLFSKSHGKTLSDDFIKAKENAAKLYDQITALQDKIKAAPAKAPETPAYKEASEAAEQYKAEIESLEAEIQKLAKEAGIDLEKLPSLLAGFKSALESGTKVPVKLVALQPIGELEQKLEDARQKFNEAESAKQELLDSRQAYDFSAYDGLVAKLNQVNNSAFKTINELQKFSGTSPEPTKWELFRTVLGKIGAIAKRNISILGQFFKTLGSGIINRATSALKNLGSAMSGLNRHTRSSNGLLEIGFKKLVQYGLGIRTVFLLVKKLRQALIDGFGYMTQYSGEFNNTVSQFVSALNTLKLAFATAFAPIASVALPLLTALMNALISVMNVIGKFFAAITGKSTFIQAKRQQVDYAASLDKTAKSGGKAAKGIKKADKAAKDAQKTIAGFDDVEILKDKSKDDADTGGSGGGGGGGLGDLGKITGADMFETVGIESKIKDFANKLRDLIGAQDWTGLGIFLGQCINSVFEKARDLISWDNIGERIRFFVTAITETFNALVDTIDWDLIGSTFAEGINTIVKTLWLLVQGIDWGNLGTGIGQAIDALFRDIDWQAIALLVSSGVNMVIDSLYGFITSVDFGRIGADLTNGLDTAIATVKWGKLGKTLGKAVNNVFEFLYKAIKNFNWKGAATQLATALNNFVATIDWKKVGATVYELFIGVLEFFRTAAREFDWAGLGKAIGDFLTGINWLGVLGQVIDVIAEGEFLLITGIGGILLGALEQIISSVVTFITGDEGSGQIVAGFFEGILGKLADIRNWVATNIFDPFMDAFKSVFGIASPSTVMEEQGGFIIDGLVLGITNAWHGVTEFFSSGVSSIIELIKKSNWKESAETAVEKIRSSASKKWSTVTKFFGEGTKTVISSFKKSDWKGSGETAVNETKSGISNNWSKISRQFSSGTQEVISKFKNSDWKGTGEESINKTKSGVDNKWSTLAKVFTTGVTNISNHIKTYDWNSAGSQIVSKLHTGVHNNWSASIHQYFVSKITAIGEYIKGFNWSGVGNNIVSKLKSGINDNWTITSYFGDKIESIKNKFNNTNWWKIGENICSGIKNGISNGWSWVTDKAKDLADATYKAAKNKLGIKSPSRVFRDGIGKMIPAGMAAGIEDNADTAINAVKKLSNSLSNTDMPGLEIPSIAVGKVIPYDSGKTTNRVDTTLADVANLLKYNQEHALTREDLEAAMQAILPNLLRDYISFYIGDEQIARHANAGNVMLDRRFSTTG